MRRDARCSVDACECVSSHAGTAISWSPSPSSVSPRRRSRRRGTPPHCRGALRARRLRENVLEELAVTLARERDERAGAAVAEERSRIARELHDVVAHAISVIVLQARGGRRLIGDEPEEARGAFDTIERTGAEA